MLGNFSIPVFPIMCVTDLLPVLNKLRLQMSTTSNVRGPADLLSANRLLISHCVRGPPLSDTHVNYLTDICADLKDLAANASVPKSQQIIRDFLGDYDGNRVIAFFTEGPTTLD